MIEQANGFLLAAITTSAGSMLGSLCGTLAWLFLPTNERKW